MYIKFAIKLIFLFIREREQNICQNALFADAIATALRNFDSGFEVYQSESPVKTTDMCVFTEANVLNYGGQYLHAVEN